MTVPQKIVIVNEDEKAQTIPSGNDVSKAISRLKLEQNELKHEKIQQLVSTISNPETSFIDKTRARLALALLQGDGSTEHSKVQQELDAIRGTSGGGVAKTKSKVEKGILKNEQITQREAAIRCHREDLAKEALQRRVDAKRRAEEQRKKLKDAEQILLQLEKEAEEAIAKAKDATKRANQARVEAGKEKKKALELESQIEALALQHMEYNSPNADDHVLPIKTTAPKLAPSPRDSRVASIRRQSRAERQHESSQHPIVAAPITQRDIIQQEVDRVEAKLNVLTKFSQDWFQVKEELVELQIKLGESEPVCNDISLPEERRKDEQIEQEKINKSDADNSTGHVVEGYSSKYFEVSLKLEELQKERDELDARLREREVTIDRLRGKNKLHEEKIKSVNEYIGAEGQTQQFWKHQSKILVKKLEKVRLSKIEQEEEVVIMKGQIVIKQKEIEELTAEVVDLRQTKDQLDSELLAAEKTQQSILLELKEEASALLEEKERALNTLKIVQASHAKVIADHEEQINVLRDDIATYQKELDDAKIILDGTEMNTNTSDTQDDSLLWKKKATNLSFRLDVLKDEAKVWKKEIARLNKLASENKKLKKRMKELQVKVDVFKEEIKERNAKIKALRKQSLTTDTALLEGLLEGIDTEQKDTDFWKGEAARLQDELRKLERHSRVSDVMLEMSSNEISQLNKRQANELDKAHDPSFDVEEINMAESQDSQRHDSNKVTGVMTSSSITEIDEKVKLGYKFSPKGYEGRVVFLLSCKLCTKDLHYIGTAHRDVIDKIDEHFNEVWKELQKTRAQEREEKEDVCNSSSGEATDDFFLTSTFSKHLLQHCEHIESENELASFLQKHVRIEVLQKDDRLLHVKRLRLTNRHEF